MSLQHTEPKKIERLWFSQTTPRPAIGCKFAELDQAGLLRVQAQCKLRQSRLQFDQEAFRIRLVLEADNGVIRVPNDNHVAIRTATPLLDPQVVDVVQVDVGKQRRYHRPSC